MFLFKDHYSINSSLPEEKTIFLQSYNESSFSSVTLTVTWVAVLSTYFLKANGIFGKKNKLFANDTQQRSLGKF